MRISMRISMAQAPSTPFSRRRRPACVSCSARYWCACPARALRGSAPERATDGGARRTRGSDSPAGSRRDVTGHQIHAALPTGRLPTGRLPTGRLPTGRLPTGRLPSAAYCSRPTVCRIFMARWCPARRGMAGSPENGDGHDPPASDGAARSILDAVACSARSCTSKPRCASWWTKRCTRAAGSWCRK